MDEAGVGMIEYGIKVKLGILPDDIEAEPISLYNIVHDIGDIPFRSSILQLLTDLFAITITKKRTLNGNID